MGLGLLYPLVACEKGKLFMNKNIVLSVTLYNFFDYTMYDIYLNRIDLGVAAEYGSTGIVTGVNIPFGVQTLTWRHAASGETYAIKNSLEILLEQIQTNTRYLGVHIYPDFTAEFTFSEHLPDTTPRGDDILKKAGKI